MPSDLLDRQPFGVAVVQHRVVEGAGADRAVERRDGRLQSRGRDLQTARELGNQSATIGGNTDGMNWPTDFASIIEKAI